MRGDEFHAPLNRLLPRGHVFGGVVAHDELPNKLKVQEFYICNTAKSNEGGRHWFLLHRRNKDTVIVFDSLGTNQNYIAKHFGHLKGSIDFTSKQLQPDESSMCGEYVMYAICCLYFNADQTFEDVMKHYFSTDMQENERRVKEFMRENEQ